MAHITSMRACTPATAVATDLARCVRRCPRRATAGGAPARSRPALEEVDDNLAPVAPVPLTALMAKAAHYPAYLAAGIWPVAPLAHPTLVRFAEQLPLEWRAGKRLLRERLRRTGLTTDVVDPPQPEAFSDLMQTGLRRHGLSPLKAMLGESRLVDLGYLDHAALEVGLRGLDRAGCPT